MSWCVVMLYISKGWNSYSLAFLCTGYVILFLEFSLDTQIHHAWYVFVLIIKCIEWKDLLSLWQKKNYSFFLRMKITSQNNSRNGKEKQTIM